MLVIVIVGEFPVSIRVKKMYLGWSAGIFYDHYQLEGIAMKCTCTVCSRTFSCMGDSNRHMASVHDGTCYPCQCGKVFSRKDVRFRHQRTYRRWSHFQSLQLDPCLASESTPKTSTIPSLPWLEANLQSGMRTSKTYDPHFRVPGNMQIVGPTLSGKTMWLSKLIQAAATHFRDDTGDSARFWQALYCYGSSW